MKLHRLILFYHLLFFSLFFVYGFLVWGPYYVVSQVVQVLPFYLNYLYWAPWVLGRNRSSTWLSWFFLFWGSSTFLYMMVYWAIFVYTDMSALISWWELASNGFNQAFFLAAASTGGRMGVEWIKNQQKNQELSIQKKLTELQLIKSNINLPFVLRVLDYAETEAQKDPQLVEGTIICLSNILRHGLYETKAQYISLEKEVKVLQEYLVLVKGLQPEGIVTVKILPSALSALIVPNLLLRIVDVWLGVFEMGSSGAQELVLQAHGKHVYLSLPCDGDGSQEASTQKFKTIFPPYTDLHCDVSYSFGTDTLQIKIVNLVL